MPQTDAPLEFPRHVHGVTDDDTKAPTSKIVADQAEYDAALKDGWQATPVLTDAQKAAVAKAEGKAAPAADEAKTKAADPKAPGKK